MGRAREQVGGRVALETQRVSLAEDKEPAGRGSFRTAKGELVIDK